MRESSGIVEFGVPLNRGRYYVNTCGAACVHVNLDDISVRKRFGASTIVDAARPARDNTHRNNANSSAVRVERAAGAGCTAKPAGAIGPDGSAAHHG